MFTFENIRYYADREAEGNGKNYELGHVRTVHAEWFIEPSARAIANLSRSFEHHVSRNSDEPQMHSHNVIFNLAPRPRDPALPLAGTVFDPRRYRRP